MLNPKHLANVSTVVVHENSPGNACPDGTAAAIILRDALPKANIVFVNHDAIAKMTPKAGVLFCDIAPVTFVDEWLDAGAIVIDHHEKQREVVERFVVMDRGVYESGHGISGASLAYEHVWYPNAGSPYDHTNRLVDAASVKHFAGLAAVRDSWHKGDSRWTEACQQAEALRFYPWLHFPLHPFSMMKGAEKFETMMSVGPMLYEKRQEQAKIAAERAYLTTTKKGTRVAIIGSVETSDVADIVDADVLVGFRYFAENVPGGTSRPKLVLSFRARGDYDVGELAKSLGGGGHRPSAGATLDLAGDAFHPFFCIRLILDNYEQNE
jgi:hypothetical protein